VKGAGFAHALDQDAGGFIDENAHELDASIDKGSFDSFGKQQIQRPQWSNDSTEHQGQLHVRYDPFKFRDASGMQIGQQAKGQADPPEQYEPTRSTLEFPKELSANIKSQQEEQSVLDKLDDQEQAERAAEILHITQFQQSKKVRNLVKNANQKSTADKSQ
jgi:hypothetical protein